MGNNIKSINWLFKRVKRYIPSLFFIAIIAVASSYIGVRSSLVIRDLIDSAATGSNEDFKGALILIVVIVAVSLILKLYRRHLAEKLAFDMDRSWKKELLHELLHCNYQTISDYHSGNLLSRINSDVRVVDRGLISLFPGILGVLTGLITAIVTMGQLEPELTIMICIGGAIIVICSLLLRNMLKELHKRAQEANAKVSSFIQEVLERLFTIQALDVAEEMEKREEKLLEERYRVQIRRKNVGLLTSGGLKVICILAEMGILVWCVFKLRSGFMTFGTLLAMVQLFGKLESPFLKLSGIVPQYVAMVGSTERIQEICELSDSDTKRIQLPTVDAVRVYKNMISLKGDNISFRYDDSQEENVLSEVSFEIRKATFCTITGQSGIGKSTLLKLLLGVYRPDSGRLYIEETGQEDLLIDRSTRSLFAYVPQGNMLFSGTLKENLLLTRPGASETELMNAVKTADMDKFIEELPDGLNTVIGENALGLSEGQAQRISIARAVLSGKPIILLDEATSALDAETERRVLSNIKGIDGVTCIAVTHRPAAVEMSDSIIELK